MPKTILAYIEDSKEGMVKSGIPHLLPLLLGAAVLGISALQVAHAYHGLSGEKDRLAKALQTLAARDYLNSAVLGGLIGAPSQVLLSQIFGGKPTFEDALTGALVGSGLGAGLTALGTFD